MKKNIARVRLDGAKLGVDFVVVSKYGYQCDYDSFLEDFLPGDFIPFEEGMDESAFDEIADTFFQEELIEYVYDVGPNVNIELAVTLGLGVIQSLHDGNLYLYNADTADYKMRLDDEMLRLGMYYQIMNPDYDDRHLDQILQADDGIQYLSALLFCHSTYNPIETLLDIFASKKGNHNNIVSIKFNK